MEQLRQGRNIKALWVLVLLGISCSSLLYYQIVPIGFNNVEGILGVLLGLYICSHPAANVVDMLFFGREGRSRFRTKRSAVLWWALNMLVFLIGWVSIFLGTTRLIGRAN